MGKGNHPEGSTEKQDMGGFQLFHQPGKYDYFEYLLTEIPKHLDDTDRSFLNDLLPWSPNLPANCRKTGKEEVK